LTVDEWNFLARLVENRRHVLLSEIRHTDKRAFREGLQAQLDMAERILSRIPIASAVPEGKD
jgi:hypothetical protein